MRIAGLCDNRGKFVTEVYDEKGNYLLDRLVHYDCGTEDPRKCQAEGVGTYISHMHKMGWATKDYEPVR